MIALLALCSSLVAFAQEEQDISRNRSKYANDQFSEDDQYTVTNPYETVTVGQTKSKRIKNVIVMIGDGMGVEHIPFVHASVEEERKLTRMLALFG